MTATHTIPEDLQAIGTVTLEAAAKDPKGPQKLRLVVNSGEPMDLAGFYDKVLINLSGVSFASEQTPIIASHDPERRIGHAVTQRIERGQIVAEGVVSSESEDAQAFERDARKGFPFQMSVGARIVDGEFLAEGKTKTVNGKSFSGPLIIAKKTLVREFSILTLGADPKTSATLAAQLKGNPPMKTDTNTPDLKAELARVEQINAACREHAAEIRVPIRFHAEISPPPAREFSSVAEIRAHGMRGGAENSGKEFATVEELRAWAIDTGADPRDVSLALIRASRTDPPTAGQVFSIGGSGRASSTDVMSAALLLKAGYSDVAQKAYDERILHAADKMRAMHLMDFARMCCQAEGQYVDFRNPEATIKAAFSTLSMTNALGGGIDKLMGVRFDELTSSWRPIPARKPLTNFRQHTVISAHQRGELEEVGAHGQVKYGYATESTFNVQLATYAKNIGVSRQTLRNDDLSFFDEVATVLVVQAARKVNDLFWATLLGGIGTTFFDGTHNNSLSEPLSLAGLEAALILMAKQRGPDAEDLDIKPTFLIVPPELSVTARGLLESIELARSGDGLPTGNPFKNINLQLVSDSRLSNSERFANASGTHWFLSSSPVNQPMIAAFLDGKEGPSVDFHGIDSNPDFLGVTWRVYHDIGFGRGNAQAMTYSNPGSGSA